MKQVKFIFVTFLIIAGAFFSSCGKGYEVRFTNYDTEVMDTVIIGNNAIIFNKLAQETTTEYRKVPAGDQIIKCITKTKKVYTSTISIPKKDGGKRTIQIDGLNAISVLED